jgi:hypothetical protein
MKCVLNMLVIHLLSHDNRNKCTYFKTWRRRETLTTLLSENLNGRADLGNLGEYAKIILKLVLKTGCTAANWIQLVREKSSKGLL